MSETEPARIPDELRARAEARLQAQPERASARARDPDLQRVLHELEVHQIELEMQNEELRRSQAELERARATYFDLYDLAPVGYLTLGDGDQIVRANLTAAGLLGVERRDLLRRPFTRFILPDDQDVYYHCRRALLATGTPQRCEVRLGPASGASPRWLSADVNLGPPGAEDLTCRVALTDLTARKRAETALQAARDELERRVAARTAELEEDIRRREHAENALRQAVADKETLLREVHHRTKNNLQMLCDLLYLQMEGTADAEKASVLRDSYGRIYAIARLHEQLYQSLEAGRIALDTYLARVVDGLRSVYPGIDLHVAAPANVVLDVDRAVHIGLIVNELATNALKHAFPAGTSGEVLVQAEATEDALTLTVRDTGRGVPGNLDLAARGSLGLRIVQILARRLGGAVTVANDGGAIFTLTFPLRGEPAVEPRCD